MKVATRSLPLSVLMMTPSRLWMIVLPWPPNATLLPSHASVKIAERPESRERTIGLPKLWCSIYREVCSEKQILAGAVSADHLCRVTSGLCSGPTETESVEHLGWNQFNRQDGAAG